MKKLMNGNKCPNLINFANLNLTGDEGKNYLLVKCVKEIVSSDISVLSDKVALASKFDAAMANYEFSLSHEKLLLRNKFVNECMRLSLFLKDYKILSSVPQFVKLELRADYIATVVIDLVLEKGGEIFCVRLNSGKSSHTLKSGTSNFYMEDPYAYGLYLAAKQLYPNYTNHSAILYFMQHKNDDGNCEKFEAGALNKTYHVANFKDCEFETEMLINVLLDKVLYSASPQKDPYVCDRCHYKDLCLFEKSNESKFDRINKEHSALMTHIELTDDQAEVANFKRGVGRVIAGPGSGKTSTLCQNIVTNILEGVSDPSKILLITFTEKGVEELRTKLVSTMLNRNSDLVGLIDDLTITTFNAFGYKIIQDNYEYLSYTKVPSLIMEDEQQAIVSELLSKCSQINGLNYLNPFMKVFSAKGAILKALELIEKYKNDEDAGKVLIANTCGFDSEVFLHFIESYNQIIASENLLEYNDQVSKCIQLFKNSPDLLRHYEYDLIIIDEFQDTSLEQLSLIQMMHESNQSYDKTLIVCGDECQAIFGFRGVGPKNFIDFKRSFPETIDFSLHQNFRSTKNITHFSNAIVHALEEKIAHRKDLISKKHDGPPVKTTEESNVFTAVQLSFKAICNLIEVEKIEPDNIAFIASTRVELQLMIHHLKERGIPAVVVVSEYLRDNQSVIGLSHLANYILHPQNTLSLTVWGQTIDEEFVPTVDLDQYIAVLGATIQSELSLLETDAKKIEWILDKIKSMPSDIGIETLIDMITERNFTSFNRMLVFLANIVQKNSGIMTNAKGIQYKAVTLTTIHASKGKEWPHVVFSAVGLKKSTGVGNEESLRTYFVGCTRAKESLHVFHNPNFYS